MRAILVGLMICCSALAKAAEDRTLVWQGIERQYRVHNVQPGPAPTVFYLHHHYSTERAIAAREDLSALAWDRLDALAVSEAFVTVSPAARLGRWSMIDGLGDRVAHPEGGLLDDVGFIFAVAKAMVDEGIADPERLYVTGISDGAMTTFLVICSPGNPFRAAAPFVGWMYEAYRAHCLAPPVPVMVVAGTTDRILPYDGWIYEQSRGMSVPETMEFWRQRHGCTRKRWKKFEDAVAGDNSEVVRVWWTGCDRDFAVELLRVEGGGHTAPGPEPVSDEWRERAGGHNQDIDSVALAWRFMQRFPEPPELD